MEIRSARALTLAFLLTAAPVAPASAQEDANAAAAAEAARLNAQAGVANAEAARINAEAARDKARIGALGLPSFDGKTTLNTGAGAMEATMLASYALAAAAEKIGESALALRSEGKPYTGRYLVLAGEEATDFSQVGMLRTQLDAIRILLQQAIATRSPQKTAAFVSPTLVIGAIGAAAGLLRADTEVTALDLPALSNRALASSVASRLAGKAIFPSAAIAPATSGDAMGPDKWEDKSLLQAFNSLIAVRQVAFDAIGTLPADAKDQTAKQKALLAAIARFDAFAAKATSPDDKGVVPLARAAQLDAIISTAPRVLRVFVEKAGGSLINTKNIATTLGVDPVKVSGGLVASYTITNPQDGSVLAADVLICRTTLSRLRPIQEADWSIRSGRNEEARKARCASALDQDRGAARNAD